MHSTGAGMASPFAVGFAVVSGVALCVAASPRGVAAKWLRRAALVIGVANVLLVVSIILRLWR